MNSSVLIFCCTLFVKILRTPSSILFLYSHEDSHPSAFLWQLKLIGLSFVSTQGEYICIRNCVSVFRQNLSKTDHRVTFSHPSEILCLNLSWLRTQTDIKIELHIIGDYKVSPNPSTKPSWILGHSRLCTACIGLKYHVPGWSITLRRKSCTSVSYDLKCSTQKPVRKTIPPQSKPVMILPECHSEGLPKEVTT